MSYQVGQIRGSGSFSPITTTVNDSIEMASSLVDDFKDVGIFSNQAITLQNNYFLDFKVKRLFTDGEDKEYKTLTFKVALLKQNEQSKYEIVQLLDTFVAYPYEIEDTLEENKYAYFSIGFKPVVDVDCIGIVLNRISYDYINPTARKVETTANRFGIVNNILPKAKVDKIGVIASPGFPMVINGEPIKVGRSGIFEINNGLKITFFGSSNTDETFILDYAYDE